MNITHMLTAGSKRSRNDDNEIKRHSRTSLLTEFHLLTYLMSKAFYFAV